jgi:outer membrane protein assembly factor BamE
MRNLYFCSSFFAIRSRRCSKIFLLAVLTNLSLSSCATIFNNLPGVYTLEVQQGNIVDQAMVDQLRPNMSKRQVLYIMGSPMVVDVFHQSSWDYIYSDQPSGEKRVQKRISLYFDNDQLSGIQGDFRPGTQPALKVTGENTVDVPKRDLEKTLWEKLTGLVSYKGYDEDATKKDKADATSEKNSTLSK